MSRRRCRASASLARTFALPMCPWDAAAAACAAFGSIPSRLTNSPAMASTGGVRNSNSHEWRNVTIRLVAPRSPFVDHSQARAAIAGSADFAGAPVTGLNASEEFGTLRAASSERYSITVRRSQLPVLASRQSSAAS